MHDHSGKPAPQPSTKAAQAERIWAALERRQAEKQRAVAIVRALSTMKRKVDRG